MRRCLLVLLAMLITFGASPLPARAEKYPSMPIRFVVPYAAGGAIDLGARPLAEKVSAILGVPVVVDNRAGASGNIGVDVVMTSFPDGYTFLVGSAFVISNPILQPELKWTYRNFVPVALAASAPNVLAVSHHSPFNTVADLVAYAKANPGKLSVANPGIGSSNHLGIELFLSTAGIDMLVVPYNGAAQTIPAGITGEVSLILPGVAVVANNVKAGNLKALAIGSDTRSAMLPDVPTLAESGLGDATYTSWFGVMAPKGTSPDIVERVNAAINQALHDPDLIARYTKMGVQTAGGTPAEFEASLRHENDVIGRLIKQRNIRIN